MFFHQVLILTELADAGPFVGLGIPPFFPEVARTYLFLAKLAAYVKSYHSLA